MKRVPIGALHRVILEARTGIAFQVLAESHLNLI
jgi:hypothetical protein